MEGRTNPRPWPRFSHPWPYTEKEIREQGKNLILAMQGAWTSRYHRSWECVNSLCEEHCPGPVHMWRRNTDGTKRFMTRTDMLTNRTMYLIGRIPLDIENLLMWKLHYRLKQIPRPPLVHGCINDCLYLQATPPGAPPQRMHKCHCYLCTSGEGPCDEMNQKSIEADKANDEMAQRVERLLAEHHWLSWSDDGAPIFKVEKDKTKDGHEVVTLGPAPETPHRWNFVQPKLSVWTANTWDNDPLIKVWGEEDEEEAAQPADMFFDRDRAEGGGGGGEG